MLLGGGAHMSAAWIALQMCEVQDMSFRYYIWKTKLQAEVLRRLARSAEPAMLLLRRLSLPRISIPCLFLEVCAC